jgi:hypothetical protein
METLFEIARFLFGNFDTWDPAPPTSNVGSSPVVG